LTATVEQEFPFGSVSVVGNCPESNGGTTHLNGNIFPNEAFNMSKKSLLPKRVCDALSLADMRESLYGLNSLEDDIEALERCSLARERKLYHSLVLRINERKILQKLIPFRLGKFVMFLC